MIPLSLRLRNFMSYGEAVPPLDFEAFHIACLCGENGHGKSALLDAITWALWGRSRAKSEDDLIQIGQTEMEVEFEFALGAERYCVLRKRGLRAGGRRTVATPVLELQISDGDGYRPLSGESVSQTQAIIQSVLRIDYDTFINSAFIVQGRADEFTLKSPAERKRVLAELLGLGRYSELEERAREESRRCNAERLQIQSVIVEMDAELTRRGEYEAELASAAERIAQAEEQRRLADAELHKWQAELRAIQERSAQLAALRQRRTQDQRELTTLESHFANEQRDLLRLEGLVARGPEVRAAQARLIELRGRDQTLGQTAAQLLQLAEERGRLERQIAAAREQIVGEQQVVRAELARLATQAGKVEALAEQIASLEQQSAGLRKIEEERENGRVALQELGVELRSLSDANERLRAEMNGLKEKLELLREAGAVCPLCQTELTPAGRAALVQQLGAEGKLRGDQYRDNGAHAKQFEGQRAATERAIREADARLAAQAGIEGQVATARRAHEEARAAAAALAEVSARLAALDARLAGGGFLPDEQGRLAELVEQIAAAGYDQAQHERVRAELAELRGVDALAAEVVTAEAAIDPARLRLQQTSELLAARREALKLTDEQLADLETEAARLAEIEAIVRQASAAVDAAIEQSRFAHQALGVARQRIDHCHYLEQQRAERAAAAARCADEKAIYDELALAFGKNGIQAMIIENAIPEIEQEANDLLHRLTDGQLSLSFQTQRAAKFGQSTIETLDINISDSYGTRNYEMYSGGEAFRINFAIRVALSKLLARRAGAQLQMLVVDEGFGTQDAAGRDRLVEAINTVASEFEKILVVTHIQELKDAFPVRIDVVKGPEGSRIAATTVLDG